MSDLEVAQKALGRLDDRFASVPDQFKPRVDALRAVLRADLNDRRIGLTVEGEYTPGLRIASTQ